MTEFFKPEDFNLLGFVTTNSMQAEYIANIANALIEKKGRVIYSIDTPEGYVTGQWSEKKRFSNSYNKAILINIEPIEKCRHPKESLRANDPNIIHGFTCLCGAKIKLKDNAEAFEEVE